MEDTLVNINGNNFEIINIFKYPGVHLNNKLDWSHITNVLYRKDQSRLHLLRNSLECVDLYLGLFMTLWWPLLFSMLLSAV